MRLTSGGKRKLDPRTKDSIRIVVVDDHRFMRELISVMLARQSDRYQVVAEHGDARSAIAACRELNPDLLILDINLPDLSGIDAVPRIKKLALKTRILLCTAFVTDERVVDALRCGADGFVEKTNTWEDFIEAVERVSQGEKYFRAQSRPGLAKSLAVGASSPRFAAPIPLSKREQEVLTLIAHGKTTKEIAGVLGLSIGTLETHRAHIMRKVKVRNVAELVVYAFRAGLIRLAT
jgi:DNA-binding NarL/FixJ family response regulator